MNHSEVADPHQQVKMNTKNHRCATTNCCHPVVSIVAGFLEDISTFVLESPEWYEEEYGAVEEALKFHG